MRLPSTPATELQRLLRDEVRAVFPGGRVVVAVQGDGAAGFADGLAAVYREAGIATFRAHLDDFLRPRADRAGRTGAERYDIATFRRVLIDPFRDAAQTSATTGFQLAAFDAERDMPAPARWVTGPTDATLVVDGADLLDERLMRLWDWRISLTDAVAADVLIDHSDPSAPKRVS